MVLHALEICDQVPDLAILEGDFRHGRMAVAYAFGESLLKLADGISGAEVA